ncbi:hypothetical protein E2C01_007933 [Portunus trituberculatus]|uniref:Uncharacterized protein n=1 Tax=Portunus trituberculatus TaxID=210409 RepID=A0A5B7D0G2_PORTR|nr:hypothetical protein [Portunus trituberculatus]
MTRTPNDGSWRARQHKLHCKEAAIQLDTLKIPVRFLEHLDILDFWYSLLLELAHRGERPPRPLQAIHRNFRRHAHLYLSLPGLPARGRAAKQTASQPPTHPPTHRDLPD